MICQQNSSTKKWSPEGHRGMAKHLFYRKWIYRCPKYSTYLKKSVWLTFLWNLYLRELSGISKTSFIQLCELFLKIFGWTDGYTTYGQKQKKLVDQCSFRFFWPSYLVMIRAYTIFIEIQRPHRWVFCTYPFTYS